MGWPAIKGRWRCASRSSGRHDALVLRVTNTIAADATPGADGIGLTNVRERLAVQFEGRASLAAGPRGAQWVSEITLPVMHASPDRRSTRHAARRGGRMMNVIIVDDEQAGRRRLRELCEAEGDLCVIGEYGDGATALAQIRAQRPQLLFLDIQMGPDQRHRTRARPGSR